MKKYPFVFSKSMYAVFALGLLLCGAGIAVSIYRLVVGSVTTAYDWIGFVVMVLACLFLGALIISMLIRTVYTVDEEYFTLHLGFVRNRYPLNEIISVHLFEGAGKLAVYFQGNRYSAIVIKREQFDDFIHALTTANDKIGFSYSTAEEEEQFKNKK